MTSNVQDEWLDIVKSGDLKKISSMLKKIGVDATSGLGPSALHVAASLGLTDVCSLLLDKGADIHKRNLGRNGATALHLAVHGEFIDTVKLLIERNADPLKTTHSGQTVLELIDDRDSELYKLVEPYYNKKLKERARLADDFDEAAIFSGVDAEPAYCTFDAVADLLSRRIKGSSTTTTTTTTVAAVAPPASAASNNASDGNSDSESDSSSASSGAAAGADAKQQKSKGSRRRRSKKSSSSDKKKKESSSSKSSPSSSKSVSSSSNDKSAKDDKPKEKEKEKAAELVPKVAKIITGVDLSASGAKLLQYQDIKFDEPECILGRGVSSIVRRATYHGTPVAVKVIQCDAQHISDALAALNSELAVYSVLRHPNIVTVLGGCKVADSTATAIIMELMPGGSLYGALHVQRRPFTSVERLLIAHEVAVALAYCHGSSPRVIHRDLKSANVLLGAANPISIVKVGDFGSSRLTAAGASAMTANVGTAQWSAPELLMGADDYGCEVDVYSFGILLWELFSGAVPYAGSVSAVALGVQVVSKKLRPTPKVPPQATPDVVALFEHCWQQEPADRPTFTQVVERLSPMLDAARTRAATAAATSNDDSQACTICMDHKREMCFEACGHVCVCEECSKSVDKCPICSQKSRTIKLFNV